MNSLPELLARDRLIVAFVQSAQQAMTRTLGLSQLLIETDETVKRTRSAVATADQDQAQLSYPYSALVLSDIMSVRDQASTQALRRIGAKLGGGLDDLTRATTLIGHIYPQKIGASLKYFDNEPLRALLFASSCCILSQHGGVSFSCKIAGSEYQGRVEFPESTSVPLADTGNANEPSAIMCEVSLVIHCYSGIVSDVSSVSSSRASVSTHLQRS